MADVLVTSSELKIDNYFVDGDTRTITLKNPSPTVGSAQIAELQTWMQTQQPILGDKLGAAFGKILSATKVNTQSIYLDVDN